MFLILLAHHLRAPAPRVLRAGVQLRRDVRRDAGPRDPAGRRALRGRHRPQAAARARTSTRPRSRSSTPPRCGRCASSRCSRSRSPRCCSRSKRAVDTDARRVDRRAALRARDGGVRAARRAGGELRGVHAAVDDGGDPVRATRARRRRGRRRRAGHAREADRRGHVACRSLYLLARGAREARSRRGRARVHGADRCSSPSPSGPSQLLYWAVLGNGSYLGVTAGRRWSSPCSC